MRAIPVLDGEMEVQHLGGFVPPSANIGPLWSNWHNPAHSDPALEPKDGANTTDWHRQNKERSTAVFIWHLFKLVFF